MFQGVQSERKKKGDEFGWERYVLLFLYITDFQIFVIKNKLFHIIKIDFIFVHSDSEKSADESTTFKTYGNSKK